jgi:hypothetical protein
LTKPAEQRPLEYAAPRARRERNWHEWNFWIVVGVLFFALLVAAFFYIRSAMQGLAWM